MVLENLITSHHAAPTGEERDHGNNQKNKEQDLGDARSRSGDATEPEKGSDDSNDKEYDGVVKHWSVPRDC